MLQIAGGILLAIAIIIVVRMAVLVLEIVFGTLSFNIGRMQLGKRLYRFYFNDRQ